MKNIVIMLLLLMSTIANAQKEKTKNQLDGNLRIEEFTFTVESDTITINELRFYNPKGAFDSQRMMNDEYGHSAKEILSLHMGRQKRIIWENIKVFEGSNETFTVIADGIENGIDYYTCLMIFDSNGDDCLKKEHPSRKALIEHFSPKLKSYLPVWNVNHKIIAKNIKKPRHKGYKLIGYDHLADHIPTYYVDEVNVILDRDGKKIRKLKSITNYLNKLKGIYYLKEIAIYADKNAKYSSIDKIKSAAAKSGIDKVIYIDKPSYSPFTWTTGYVANLNTTKFQIDSVSKIKKSSIEICITNSNEIITASGQLRKIKSKDYERLITNKDVINVKFRNDLTYDNYIFWLQQTHKILKITEDNENLQTTIIEELNAFEKNNTDN